MTENKCGDCFHAELCEKSEMLVSFSKDNPAYCSMFLNSADVAPVRHGQWLCVDTDTEQFFLCNRCKCGAKMDEVIE